jgi:hypothetical protein
MANRFWVGGTGTWDASSTANWSATTGGAAGASAPTSADAVFFDALSGTGICTTANGSASAGVTLNTSTLGLTLGANHTASGTFTLTLGALDLNNFSLICTVFSSTNSNTRSIAFGTGNITLTGNAVTIWSMAILGGFTFTGTSNVITNYSGGTGNRTFQHGTTSGGTETNAVNIDITAGTDVFANSGVCKNLNFTGFSGTVGSAARTIYGNLTIPATVLTISATTNVWTFAATSGTQQITTNGKTLDFPLTQNGVGGTVQLQDNLTMGSTRTYTLTAGTLDLSSGNRALSCGIFSSSNSNTRTIAFGTGNITLTGSGTTIFSIGGNTTGFSYLGTSQINCTYSGSTGTRGIQPGTNATEAQAMNFNITAGTDTVAAGSSAFQVFKNLNFTGFSGTLTNVARRIYGNLTFSAGMTLAAGTSQTVFQTTSGTQQVTTNGLTLDFPISFEGVGGTYAFQDALTQGSTRAFTITNGTVQLKNGVTSTVGSFATSGTNQKFLQSTTPGSQATLSQASGTVDASYLTIRDINAVGGATWNAFVNQQNIDAGNNDGWDFGISPIVGSYEYTYQLRSFTQPRRF